MDVSSSMSASEDTGWLETVFSTILTSFPDDVFVINGFESFLESASTLMERCTRCNALEAAELILRCLVRNMVLRLSIPVLTIWKS